jgi:ketosteroid isomerase-like protein
VGGTRFDWRGVDKFRLKDGKIIEERVYTDTAPLRAFGSGATPEPITKF